MLSYDHMPICNLKQPDRGIVLMVRILLLLTSLLFTTVRGSQAHWDSHSAHIMPRKNGLLEFFIQYAMELKKG